MLLQVIGSVLYEKRTGNNISALGNWDKLKEINKVNIPKKPEKKKEEKSEEERGPDWKMYR